MDFKEGDEVVLIRKDPYSARELGRKTKVGSRGIFDQYCTCKSERHALIKFTSGNDVGKKFYVDECSVKKFPYVEKKFKLTLVK
jgi:hypothetical protein